MKLAFAGVKAMAAPWLAVVEPFWPLLWRAALAGALVAAGWHYGGRGARAELEEFKVAQAAGTALAVANLKTQVAERDVKLITQESASAQKLSDLEAAQRDRPARVVRVCPAASDRAVSGLPGASGVDANLERGGSELSDGAGRNIGPGLDRLVARADRLALKCLNAQERADQLAAMKPAP